MTLLDVCKLIRHYLKSFIIVVIVFTLIGVAFGYMKVHAGSGEYSAEAVITVSEPTGTVEASELMPLVQAIATNVFAEDAFEEADIALAYDLDSRTVSFTAVGSTQEESIALANDAAKRTIELTESTLAALAAQYPASGDGVVAADANRAAALGSVAFAMNDASAATTKDGIKEIMKFGLFGFAAGLFLAICMVIIIDLARTPIRGRDEIEKAFEIPVLVDGSDSAPGKRLWANIQFICEDAPSSVCLVPVGAVGESGMEQQLSAAIQSDGQGDVKLSPCASLTEDVQAAYVAHDADVTVVVAQMWKDSMKQLAATLQELSLAQANVAGVALVNE